MLNYSIDKIKKIADQLLSWMEEQDFKGWDPHDALNSPFLKGLSNFHRWAGVAALQLVKRCPINLRPFLCVPKTLNAKGMALVLAASVRRYRIWGARNDLYRAIRIAKWLDTNQAQGYSGACWGYPFDWPNRSFYAPKGTPAIVNTSFIGHALLDLFEVTRQKCWLVIAQSSCEFICRDLNRIYGGKGFCFSYTPIDKSRVHNANLLGASLLARVGHLSACFDIINTAMESASFSLEAQRSDGSWLYGDAPNQAWVDSYHTGYNLLALKYVFEASGTSVVKKALDKGYRYYLTHFFLSDGTVKYYHNRIAPLDVHGFSHALICLTAMGSHLETPHDLAQKVLEQMINHFWSGKGYFYWQRQNGLTYRLPCMRWVQSWALLALTTYLAQTGVCVR